MNKKDSRKFNMKMYINLVFSYKKLLSKSKNNKTQIKYGKNNNNEY